MRLTVLTLLVFFGGGTAQGAIIKLLKKRKVVVIDDADVSKGDKVCFYSASNRKRACGRVVKVKEEKSYVKVKSKKRFRRLKKGMTHEVSTGGGSSGGGGSRGEHSFTFRLLYTPGFMARSKFNYLDHIEDEKVNGNDGPFMPFPDDEIDAGDSTQSKMARMFPWGSGGLEAEIFITPTMSVAMGGRYTLINVSPHVTFNYLVKGDKQFIMGDYSGYELNFWLDFFPLYVEELGLRLGVGGEFTMSNLSIRTDFMEQETPTSLPKMLDPDFFKGKSVANIMSVRLSARKDFPMGAYGFGMGVTAIISPMSLSNKFTLDAKPDSKLLDKYDGNQSSQREDKMTADIETALDHTNNVFSVLFGLSFYFGQ